MPTQITPPTHDLSDYAELLLELERQGLSYVVIGGCAVGAYARLRRETVLSADLDIYVSESELVDLLRWARANSVAIDKTPQARAVPVAVLQWHELEVNALTSSRGLPPADVAFRTCREFALRDGVVHVVDPFDLLANKLQLGRPKDQPHIALLRRYLESEIKEDFSGSGTPRQRLEPAKRFLQVTGEGTLQESLVKELILQADSPPLRRFLANGMKNPQQRKQLLESAEHEAERRELISIFESSTS